MKKDHPLNPPPAGETSPEGWNEVIDSSANYLFLEKEKNGNRDIFLNDY